MNIFREAEGRKQKAESTKARSTNAIATNYGLKAQYTSAWGNALRNQLLSYSVIQLLTSAIKKKVVPLH